MPLSESLKTAIEQQDFQAIAAELSQLIGAPGQQDPDLINAFHSFAAEQEFADIVMLGLNQAQILAAKEKIGLIQNEVAEKDLFILAAKAGNAEVVNLVIELMPEAYRQQMIHAFSDLAFVEAAKNPTKNREVLNLLMARTPNPAALQRMIHADYDFAFCHAAEKGDLEFAALLMDLTPDLVARERMIGDDQGCVFTKVAGSGNLGFLSQMIEAQDPNLLRKMIHQNDDSPFNQAAKEGHIVIVNRLIGLTILQDQEDLQAYQQDPDHQMPPKNRLRGMILSMTNPFCSAITNERLEVIDRLIEVSQELGKRDGMIKRGIQGVSMNIPPITRSNALVYMAVAFADEMTAADQSGNNPRYDELAWFKNFCGKNRFQIAAIKNLQETLVKEFSQDSDNPKLEAHLVIRSLLQNSNLQNRAEDLKSLRLVSTAGLYLPQGASGDLIPFILSFLDKKTEFPQEVLPHHQEIANHEITKMILGGKSTGEVSQKWFLNHSLQSAAAVGAKRKYEGGEEVPPATVETESSETLTSLEFGQKSHERG